MEFLLSCLSLLSLCAEQNNIRHRKKRKIFSKVVIAIRKNLETWKWFRENFWKILTFGLQERNDLKNLKLKLKIDVFHSQRHALNYNGNRPWDPKFIKYWRLISSIEFPSRNNFRPSPHFRLSHSQLDTNMRAIK